MDRTCWGFKQAWTFENTWISHYGTYAITFSCILNQQSNSRSIYWDILCARDGAKQGEMQKWLTLPSRILQFSPGGRHTHRNSFRFAWKMCSNGLWTERKHPCWKGDWSRSYRGGDGQIRSWRMIRISTVRQVGESSPGPGKNSKHECAGLFQGSNSK